MHKTPQAKTQNFWAETGRLREVKKWSLASSANPPKNDKNPCFRLLFSTLFSPHTGRWPALGSMEVLKGNSLSTHTLGYLVTFEDPCPSFTHGNDSTKPQPSNANVALPNTLWGIIIHSSIKKEKVPRLFQTSSKSSMISKQNFWLGHWRLPCAQRWG